MPFEYPEQPSIDLGRALRAHSLTLATAESCTGGLIGALITDVPGSSDYYAGGVVAYANAAKIALLGVDPEVLAAEGAVSPSVAAAMADGVRRRLGTDIGLATTGVAGPGGGTPDKPVGLVYVAVAGPTGTRTERLDLVGDRAAVRLAAATAALRAALDQASPAGASTGRGHSAPA